MEALDIFKSQLQQVPDHRDKKGTYRNFHTILAVTIFGLLANNSSIDKLIRWIKLQKRTLFKYFEFSKPPCLKNHPGFGMSEFYFTPLGCRKWYALGEVRSVLAGIAVSVVRLLNPESPNPLYADFERICLHPKKTLKILGFNIFGNREVPQRWD